MSVGDVLDGAFGGLRATFVPVALIVGLLLGPLQLALNLVLSQVAPELVGGGVLGAFGQVDDAVAMGDPVGAVGVTGLFGLLAFVLGLAVGAATIAVLLQVDRGEETDIGAALRTALGVFWAAVGSTLLVGIPGFVGGIVLLFLAFLVGGGIPGIGPILAVVVFVPMLLLYTVVVLGVVSLVVPIVVVERQGPIAAVGRALWVLRRRFWRLIGITLLIGLLIGLATFALQLPFLALAGVLTPVAWIIESVGEVLSQIVSVPVSAFAALLVYLDARVRFEGIDLQVRARELNQA